RFEKARQSRCAQARRHFRSGMATVLEGRRRLRAASRQIADSAEERTGPNSRQGHATARRRLARGAESAGYCQSGLDRPSVAAAGTSPGARSIYEAEIPVTLVSHRYLVSFSPKHTPHVFTDVLVIGAGIAGLRAALEIPNTLEVLVVS